MPKNIIPNASALAKPKPKQRQEGQNLLSIFPLFLLLIKKKKKESIVGEVIYYS